MDRFPSEKYLRNFHGKVGITIDGKDVVVPEKFGLRLYNSYSGPKKLWEFPNGGHCQIMMPQPEFWSEVIRFWRTNQTAK
jgi:pimeloyl-ACP methyl ester carboxylesterase